MPEGVEAGIIKGMYPLPNRQKEVSAKKKGSPPRVQLLGSGTILREVIAGAELLAQDFGVGADIWSVTSFTELRREAMSVERWNLLHPTELPRKSYVETCLAGRPGPVIAATDYMRLFADQIRPFVAQPLPRTRHRRLRPLRLPQEAARLLRGRPPLGDGGGTQSPCRGRSGRSFDRRRRHQALRPPVAEARSMDRVNV